MTPSRIRLKVVTERAAWVSVMLEGVRALPSATVEEFLADPRTAAAAESYLRRALEALLDLGRHLLAKGFGRAIVEYKEISAALVEEGILTRSEGDLLRRLAGYRNRMVHFYHEVSKQEFHALCTGHLGELEAILGAFTTWIENHPERRDDSL
ncbi:MAG: DUF86 domain-containing protein [Deltaproteobacteria bacterium]|nr:DUF86 domain-containing protein [Deltaproteobacteria bacterium]